MTNILQATVWGSSVIKLLQKLHNRADRALTSSSYDANETHLTESLGLKKSLTCARIQKAFNDL